MRLRNKLVKEVLLLGLGVGLLLATLLVFYASSLEIPSLESFGERRLSESAKIYDRTGQVLLDDLSGNKVRTSVPLSEMSRHVKNATIAIEDVEFYEHLGIKPTAILRAVVSNLFITLGITKGYTQGGSTITQQVVKNSLLTNEKLLSRKIKEWVLSIKLERVLSKDRILELYLNDAPYGGRIYGVEEAALQFFGKHAAEITLGEAAYLAALPQAPTFYSPYGNHKEDLENRKNLVLRKMLENDFISQEEYQEALQEKVRFSERGSYSIKAPHFVFYVIEYLENKYGRDFLETAGLKITTTLDANLEEKAEGIVKRYALENEVKFNASNAALVAIDPKTGGILAMVGSRDYFDEKISGAFNAALGKRQPGSAFKPFVYAAALRKGYTPETVVFDLPTEFSTLCDPDGKPLNPNLPEEEASHVCYHPQNYDEVFRGPVTLREALAQSLNVPSVKTLYLAGIPESLEVARNMGITTLTDPNLYGLTLVLGGGEVTLLDITSAYGVFGNEGVRVEPNPIIKIEDSGGNVLEETISRAAQAISPEIARTISDILSDEAARAPAFGERSFLYFPGREVAVKTGTTNDYRDAWIVGYTPSVVVGAWAGNNDNTPMEKKVAGFIVAPLWNAFMQEVLKVTENEHFKRTEEEEKELSPLKPVLRGVWQGNVTYQTDSRTGAPADILTPKEFVGESVQTDVHSILHWVLKDDPRGEVPKDPKQDPQYELWEKPVREWVSKQSLPNIKIKDEDVQKTSGALKVTGIKEGVLYNASAIFKLEVTPLESGQTIKKVRVFLNEKLVDEALQAPFKIEFSPLKTEGVRNQNTLKILAEKTEGGWLETSLDLLLNLGN